MVNMNTELYVVAKEGHIKYTSHTILTRQIILIDIYTLTDILYC